MRRPSIVPAGTGLGLAGWLLLALLSALVASGCGGPKGKPLTPPSVTVAPHDAASGEALWAVAPLRNESGTTALDELATTDRLVRAVDQVRGVRAVPLNRTLAAMRALGLERVGSQADAARLGRSLGVSAVVVGSVTAYDPYHPTVGLTLALFSESPPPAASRPDPSRIGLAPSDAGVLPEAGGRAVPVITVSETLDGRNHQVQMDVRSYAAGRTEPLSSLGWERHLRSAPLFEEFAAFWTVDRLVNETWIRWTAVAEDPAFGADAARAGGADKAPALPDIGLKPGH